MSNPGDPGWKWFPNDKDSWRLDVVSLLAVIGESAIGEHSQTITASMLCMLPRLLPAPQALLKPSRPTRLPETHAKMAGVESGTVLDSVGFFANIILPLEDMAPYDFVELDIRHAPDALPVESLNQPHHGRGFIARCMSWVRRAEPFSEGHSASEEKESDAEHRGITSSTDRDVEEGRHLSARHHTDSKVHFDSSAANGHDHSGVHPGIVRRRTNTEVVQDLLSARTIAIKGRRPIVPPKLFSPLHILSAFSCLLSIGILIAAIFWQDGTAILAIVLVSFVSTVIGYASSWRPILMQRRHTNKVPSGDVMIRTREGAFVLVRCSEDVARELYSGTEECDYYVGEKVYRLCMALGTILLMFGVVLLGNCTWNSQIFIGGSYIILNGLYWGLGMLPLKYFWDLSRYTCKNVTKKDSQKAHGVTNEKDEREGYPSFTRTLWYAIRETKTIGWVERSGAAPGTPQWKQWLSEALENAKAGNRDWPAVKRKNEIMSGVTDPAEQKAPVVEVQGAHANAGPNGSTF
ncbi:hypothetical protein TASIC1_0006008000 [Trichoderma asperellum]|uniref:Uncharacterized protein n=1 Tax=Trichoderma asperellum TaxID=101201 RepID=A0A6V8QU69_TRIAP|nr:hypothetical protein LI328DRAFT_42451 [Trichoderma asperelloides]GFP55910.1 hypothetical protein TASIC1_0006008000 [Trichoderma asperellum]